MSTYEKTIEQLLNIKKKTWSLKSSSKWSIDNPAKGHCGVTSLGGEIRKTPISKGWHYYNIIQNTRYDFTDSQFSESIKYKDLPSNREEAFTDTDINIAI
ncbi:hypothetical protein RFW18_20660 [Metabacillus idriensis]|uniref:YunG family protein n=1 Tax=Metabacillus idriensis TaxID=324768 RepID=UPI002813420D|nr:hypothetical protein [Metabacillus idriensis]MDR0140177.1 hypothetical protein [Metabacillus idriensis]